MKFSEIHDCKNCPYTKCVFRCDYDFDICPVERKKRDIK